MKRFRKFNQGGTPLCGAITAAGLSSLSFYSLAAEETAILLLTTVAVAAATTTAAAITIAVADADAEFRISDPVRLKKINSGRGFSPIVYYMHKYKHCAIFPIRYPIVKTRLLKKYLFKWRKV